MCSSSVASSKSRTMKRSSTSRRVALRRGRGGRSPRGPVVVSGESASCGSRATISAASLTAFTSSSFAQPGWIARPRIFIRTCAPENVSGLHLAGRRAVDGVRRDRAELVDGKVDDAAADLLVGVEHDLDRAVREVGIRDEIADRGEDLGDAGLVVGAEQARPVGDDELVAGVVRELAATPTGGSPGPSVPSSISPPSYVIRCGFALPLASRAVSTWAKSAIVGTSRSTVDGSVAVT